MADNQIELLSALKDGEVNERELGQLMRVVGNDSTLRQRWQRYHVISDAMRGNLPTLIQHDLAARVAAAIQNEPTVLSPSVRTAASQAPRHKSYTGYAVAASVAVLGFLTVGLLGDLLPSPTNPTAGVAMNNAPPLAPANVAGPAASSFASVAGVTTVAAPAHPATPVQDEQAQQLRRYVLSHEYSTSNSPIVRPVLSPNVRVVTFSAEEQN